ncbi:amidohydrolase [Rhodococcus sp. 06-156-3C]|uniref:amidohydrolase family protein n=1 Tax=Nocardiaceae TaxID=85025 RepID=UPI0009B8FFE3|nr:MULTISPECIES: amidohydrolase family protein [Rhodococcus]OZD08782.1 amidohydrolase [Rhodococcus sp. 06-156-4C]OZD17359.1 amidohydrolase [Rhodococcus sp. 06-156-3C]OZD18696.1 amidohydrolase [Rhodococcus sp. 06-156-4a]OZD25103.1 amidohydrolase [Rhodococcus sp. 06-156-3b]OZD34262.1 amidohydrolase [Rhodococcus sp. 06-156-3]
MVDERFFRVSDSGRPEHYGAIYEPQASWLSQQRPEPVIEPELKMVDSHHHFWDNPYIYDVADLSEDVQSGHRVTSTVYVECGNGYLTTGPEELRPVGETEKVVSNTSRTSPGGFPVLAAGIVGFADLTLGSRVGAVLDRHLDAGDGRFKGVRFSTGWDSSCEIENTQAAKRPRMLSEEGFRAGLAVLAERDLSFDAWLFQNQLDEVADVADALPKLRIVVDHCGGPLGYGPYASDQQLHFKRWREAIRALAERPNVSCKLGGLLARGAAYDYVSAATPPTSDQLVTSWSPWINECIEAFGANRCMFESNFPVEKMGVNYSTLWNAYKKMTISASDAERHALFGGTARDFYRLDC